MLEIVLCVIYSLQPWEMVPKSNLWLANIFAGWTILALVWVYLLSVWFEQYVLIYLLMTVLFFTAVWLVHLLSAHKRNRIIGKDASNAQ